MVTALDRFHAANPLLAGASVEAIRRKEFRDAPDFFVDCLLQELEAAGRLVLDGDLV